MAHPTKPPDAAPSPVTDVAPRQPPFKLRQFNRKIPAPSLKMHASDGQHYRCPWIQDSITVHSDGNVSCGLDDPHAQRSFGNILSQTVEEIFQNPEFTNLQSKLWNGHRCSDCSLYNQETADFSHALPVRPRLPSTLIIEPTVKCNIRCLNDACHANNDPAIRTRDADLLQYSAFVDLIDQLKHELRHVYFFNYGDPFVHAQAEDMLLYLRQACPDVEVVTSTNGIPLAKPGRAVKIVQSRINTIVFTIGGITQESYSRYHGNGKVDAALQGMWNILDAKREAGAKHPIVIWRYLLFNWNDSRAEVDEAIRMAHEHGVDAVHLYLTHVPHGAASFRFAPGTPNFAKYRHFISCALSYTRLAGIVEPDSAGFFSLEDIAGLGPARWMSYKASMACDGVSGWIRLTFSTNREEARIRPTTVFVITPWRAFKLVLTHMMWRTLAIRVPRELRPDPVNIRIATPDYWFPAEELGSDDKRCLGVLVRVGDERTGWVGNSRAWFEGALEQRLTEQDEAALAEFDLDAPAALPLPDLTKGGRMDFHG